MDAPSSLYPKEVNLTNCDREPIHLIGSIQDFGMLFAFDKITEELVYHSANAAKVIEALPKGVKKTALSSIFNQREVDLIRSSVSNAQNVPIEVQFDNGDMFGVVHGNNAYLVVELEPLNQPIDILAHQRHLIEIVNTLDRAASVDHLCAATASLIKKFYGYDRVMIYQFDTDWNGEVVAEEREPHLESWLGLHYPATDIPQQARKLFLKQGVRMISDVQGKNIPILRAQGMDAVQELDLTQSELRAVSPIHIEYLANMGVGASLTAAIVFKGNLWGLIACHHYSPKYIDYFKRTSIKFITKVFSTQLGLMTTNEMLEKVNKSNKVRTLLIEKISQNLDVVSGLSGDAPNLLDLCQSSGGAIYYENNLSALGATPDDAFVLKVVKLARSHDHELFQTSCLSALMPLTPTERKLASGVLVLFLSKKTHDALIWFRQEITSEVNWGGDPNKAVNEDSFRLSPRKSFEKWTEIKTGHAKPWNDAEIASAHALKNHISEIIVQKYEEIKSLHDKLKNAYQELEAFSYSVSHDLRSPLRGIDGFAQIVKEDYFNQLDDYGKQAIETIIQSTKKMNSLIDDILAFSGLGKKEPTFVEIDCNTLVDEIVSYLQIRKNYPRTQLKVSDLPEVYGDPTMLFQLFSNLIGNAFKYSSKAAAPQVDILYEDGEFQIRDNGVGFNNKHVDKLFGIFSRLENEAFEGSGIGLAIAKRVVDYHNGHIWAKGRPGQGASFYFTLNTNQNA